MNGVRSGGGEGDRLIAATVSMEGSLLTPPASAKAFVVDVDLEGEGVSAEDPDVIIPPRYSRWLVASATLFLLVGSVSAAYAALYKWIDLWPCFFLSLVLYITSVLHWHKPRFSTYIRRIDYMAVGANLGWASYVAAVDVSDKLTVMWFVGIGIVGIVFALNETSYYYQVMRTVSGKTALKSSGKAQSPLMGDTGNASCCVSAFPSTQPGTEERNAVYQRVVAVHLVCVHVTASSLALALVIAGENERK